jgi:hypothetical protein
VGDRDEVLEGVSFDGDALDAEKIVAATWRERDFAREQRLIEGELLAGRHHGGGLAGFVWETQNWTVSSAFQRRDRVIPGRQDVAFDHDGARKMDGDSVDALRRN